MLGTRGLAQITSRCFLCAPGPGAFTVPLDHPNLGRNNKLRAIHHVSGTGEWQVRMNVDHEYEIIQEVLVDLPQSAQCYCVCPLRGPLPEDRWKSYCSECCGPVVWMWKDSKIVTQVHPATLLSSWTGEAHLSIADPGTVQGWGKGGSKVETVPRASRLLGEGC